MPADAQERSDDEVRECDGHPAGPYDPMGQTVYCDGSCQRGRPRGLTRTEMDERRGRA